MAEKSRSRALWSRGGHRGPTELVADGADADGPAGTDGPVHATVPPQPPGAAAGPDASQGHHQDGGPAPAGRVARLIDQIIAERSVHIDYQPVHDFERGQVVAFEALSRGPEGPLRSPLALFAAARAAGRLGELDWVCRAAAFQGMLDAGLPPSVSLFVNVEADSLIEPCPPALMPTVQKAEQKLRVFVDLTGRALSRYPCQALETVRRARAARWGVAINDVEFSTSGMALLPTFEPDVVKLNHQLIASGFAQANAAMMTAIGESERTGAAILVERVENHDAAMVARAAGAIYQQGHLLGRPGPLPVRLPPPMAPIPLLHHEPEAKLRTPWQLLLDDGARQTLGVDQTGLDHLISAAATRAGTGDQPAVVAVVSPLGTAAPPASQIMFSMLLERCPLIVILGQRVSAWTDWRVRAADVPAGHPIAEESCFVVLSPDIAIAIAGRRQPSAGQDPPKWDLVVSKRPRVCRAVMRQLLAFVDTLAGGVHHHS